MEDDQQGEDVEAAADRRKLLAGVAAGSLVMTLFNRPAFAQGSTESSGAGSVGGSHAGNG
jgi:hypothetical protein